MEVSDSFCLSNNISAELCDFLNNFKTAVEAHNTNGLLKLMDDEYNKEQHKKFMGGNTTQFMNEFFSGKRTTDGQYVTPDFLLIETLSFESISIGIQGYELNYTIKYKGEVLNNDCRIVIAKDNERITFGLVGASG